jgi:hypothetical protein
MFLHNILWRKKIPMGNFANDVINLFWASFHDNLET